ncbi:VOC family protein [Aminobacter sp. MDW-2]|uniref:VOC family protein n=1 Tax=Aminobacter sp. MDW-2 TaxID=2666139 RepID=UPI0012B11DBB|nr:VOC family protein [Aminobacter sp. MDW-2]MRX34705.1 glyoxalase [Aminobacter sp. MDW-2]QNH34928.1 VOC family protein [Aminobacter sp. MDW-2]
MRPTTASLCITTKRVVETRDFYIRHFGARAVFDCGWYVSLEFETGLSLQFMEPQGEQPTCDTAGLTYNFCVDDVDDEHRAMTAVGLVPVMPIEDHPWGDRGFAIRDPNGITLCIYSNREPSHEFRQFYAPRIDHGL